MYVFIHEPIFIYSASAIAITPTNATRQTVLPFASCAVKCGCVFQNLCQRFQRKSSVSLKITSSNCNFNILVCFTAHFRYVNVTRISSYRMQSVFFFRKEKKRNEAKKRRKQHQRAGEGKLDNTGCSKI